MHENLHPLLNAYLDGELHGARLRDMELHLASCEFCRTELDELRRLSDLLHDAPAPQFTPADRFASNLTLSLPRRPERTRPPQPAPLSWWLAPASLLFLWFFMRTVFALTDLVSVATESGLLGHTSAWLGDGQQQTTWFAMTTDLLGNRLTGNEQSALSLLNGINLFGGDLLHRLLWQTALILPCLGWLAVWWMRHNPLPMKIENSQ